MDEINYITKLAKLSEPVQHTKVDIAQQVMSKLHEQAPETISSTIIYLIGSTCGIACVLALIFGMTLISQLSSDFYITLETAFRSFI